MINKKCKLCDKAYKVALYRKESSNFCSYSCRGKSRTGNKNSNWKGGKVKRSDGYSLERIKVSARDESGKKYDLSHRLIMSKHLGRKLLKTEIVHHINGDNSDNRIENLELMNQSYHASLHSKQRVRNSKKQYV